MQSQIAVALITSATSLLVAVISIVMNNRILGYKVDELKKQVEKHNSVVEKTIILDRDLKTAFSRIDDMREDITRLNDHLIK